MIQYKIIVNNTRDIIPPRDRADPSAPDYQQHVFRRALTNNPYKDGDKVKIRQGHRRGEIVKVHDDFHAINWVKKVPHFIEVKFEDGVVMMCHYSQLKRNNRIEKKGS